jgi:hypothetical protein
MANHIVDIDEQTHERLDIIKHKTQRELREMDRGGRMLRVYADACKPPGLHVKG